MSPLHSSARLAAGWPLSPHAIAMVRTARRPWMTGLSQVLPLPDPGSSGWCSGQGLLGANSTPLWGPDLGGEHRAGLLVAGTFLQVLQLKRVVGGDRGGERTAASQG